MSSETRDHLPCIEKSNELWARSAGLIPAGTQTLAKGPTQYVNGVAPKYLVRGKGAHVWDVDGNRFLDFTMGVGPLVLGYTHPEVDEAIRSQLSDGITFSLMHPLEVIVAEQIRRVVPGAQSVRFSKTGCDVTTAAVRLARAFTKRNKVVCCGYHGWHDWYIATTDRSAGIPDATAALTYTFAYNDLDSLSAALDDDTACVVLEPTVFEAPKSGFLEALAERCKSNGTLLVFDEMWTGFRLALGGAQERFGVTADLACFSKAVANGMPLSVLTGRSDVMSLLEKDVFFFTTFGGEALSLAAAQATLHVLERDKVPLKLETLGSQLRERFTALCDELQMPSVRCVGYGARTMIAFGDQELGANASPLLQKSLVQQELIRRGILWTGFHNLSAAHSEADIDHLLGSYRHALSTLRQALENRSVASLLLGSPLEPVFRRTSGFHTKPKQDNSSNSNTEKQGAR